MARYAIQTLENSDGDVILLFRGDTKPLIFTLKNNAGVVIDISSKTASDFLLTAKDDVDGTQIFQVAATFKTDGTDGKLKFVLSATDLATAVNEAVMELTDTTGATDDTLTQLRFDILQDVKT